MEQEHETPRVFAARRIGEWDRLAGSVCRRAAGPAGRDTGDYSNSRAICDASPSGHGDAAAASDKRAGASRPDHGSADCCCHARAPANLG